jgi:hypothetical protein
VDTGVEFKNKSPCSYFIRTLLWNEYLSFIARDICGLMIFLWKATSLSCIYEISNIGVLKLAAIHLSPLEQGLIKSV